MHFWINKSQGCGFNGRYVPPSISAGTRRNQVPKPMVTPVHRFQSIESVASGGLHAHLHGHHGHHHNHQSHHHGVHHQHPPSVHRYHTRFPVPQQHASNHQRSSRRVSIDYVASRHRGTPTPVGASGGHTVGDGVHARPTAASATAKLKCGVWAIISMVPFMIVAAKYYLNGETIGAEVLVFLIMLVLILLAIGFVSLFEAFSQKRSSRSPSVTQISSEQAETFEESHASTPSAHPATGGGVHAATAHTPAANDNLSAANMAALEMPPPPYHIAVTLPPAHPPNDRLNIIQDSPPPTYEKAVT